jgi:hypothetical protein
MRNLKWVVLAQISLRRENKYQELSTQGSKLSQREEIERLKKRLKD